MASFMDRVKKFFKKKPKNQQPTDNDGTPATPAVDNTLAERQPQHIARPGDGQQQPIQAAETGTELQIALVNRTSSSNVYAYITGQAIDRNNALFLLGADARTPVYPASPSSTGTPISQDTAINLGAPGNTVTATVPRIAGGRIWFSIDSRLTFALNPGPGLVEPSIFNQADPNINTNFGFAEFTFNSFQLFVNVSSVDFVGPPVSLALRDTNNTTQRVPGLPANGLQIIAGGLRAQTAKDGRRWSSLIVPSRNNTGPLRILSPNSAILLNPDWFRTYWTDYVNAVWGRYRNQDIIINTQAAAGNVRGRVNNRDELELSGGAGAFAKPTAGDIFSNSSGPFATGSNAARNAVIPRLAAAFNRSTLLLSDTHPNGVRAAQYYQNPTTNHYSRLVHAAQPDGRGYAFPYDDVTPDGGQPQEGAIFSENPALLTVGVGGRG